MKRPPDLPVKVPPSTRTESPYNLLVAVGILAVGLLFVAKAFGWL